MEHLFVISYRIRIKRVNFTAEQVHVPLKLTVLVFTEGIYQARIVVHLVFFVKAHKLSLTHFVVAFFFGLLVITFCRYNYLT